jgi:hypothetical protein
VLWFCNRSEHRGCLSKSMCGSPVASDVKNIERHDVLSWFGLLSPTSSSVVFFMLGNAQIRNYNNGD